MPATPQQQVAKSGDVAGLVAQCLSGDDRALAVFYERYRPLVANAVLRQLGRSSVAGAPDAEDLVQDVFAYLFKERCRALHSLHAPASIDAWLMTVAQNRVRSHLRKEAARERLEEAKDLPAARNRPPSPRGQAVANERREQLETALRELNGSERLVVNLYYLHGLSYAEIAETAALNINTVASKLRRARQKLRGVYEDLRTQEDAQREGADR